MSAGIMHRLTIASMISVALFAIFSSIAVMSPWTPVSVIVDADEYVTTLDGKRIPTGYTFGWMQEVVRMPMKEYLDSLEYISLAQLAQPRSEFTSCTKYVSFGVSMIGFSFSHSSGETDMSCYAYGNLQQ